MLKAKYSHFTCQSLAVVQQAVKLVQSHHRQWQETCIYSRCDVLPEMDVNKFLSVCVLFLSYDLFFYHVCLVVSVVLLCLTGPVFFAEVEWKSGRASFQSTIRHHTIRRGKRVSCHMIRYWDTSSEIIQDKKCLWKWQRCPIYSINYGVISCFPLELVCASVS